MDASENVEADGLDPKQQEALAALLNHPTLAQAAKALGVSERTLYRYLEVPAFKAAYRRARRESFAHAMALTERYAPMAVQTLGKVMSDPQAPFSAKVAAATNLLRFGREALELDDLAQRVEALEKGAENASARERVGVPGTAG